ncbi:MAG: phosphatase PAP2 family protein [Candidatus Methylopumilus sp.]|nr:phosphatase PAP2 family protein [Candidatus Methylopumilus sp.]
MLVNQSWMSSHREVFKWISDNMMYGFYAFFIGMLIWGYKSQDKQLRIIGWGYLLAQAIGSIFIVRVLKVMLGHARPDHLVQATNGVLDAWVGPSLSSAYNSFPSGHTCDYLTSCLFLAICLPKIWMRVLVILLAVFNGALRVMLAKHFPLDVLGGVLIAGLTALGVWRYWVLPRLNENQLLKN